MNTVSLLVLIILLDTAWWLYAAETTCGPNDKCTCDNKGDILQMDCSYNHNLCIEDICEFINLYATDVRALKAGSLNIGSVRPSDIKGCHGLFQLDLQNNQLTRIEQGVFNALMHLTHLDLTGNSLNVYDVSFNSSVLPKNLEVLSIAGNLDNSGYGSPTYPDLTALTNLKTLYADGLDAKFESHYAKTGIENLTISTLKEYTKCNIKEVFNDTFVHIKQLKHLDLSGCPIENIHAGAFEKLSQLQRLDLSYNQRLGFASFANVSYALQFTSVYFLNYSKVHTTFGLGTEVLKRDICYLRNSNLKELALDSNRIQLIETDALMLLPPGFKTLHINDNKFTFGPYLLQLACAKDVEEFYGDNQHVAGDPKHYLFEPPENADNHYRDHDSNCPFMSEKHLKKIASDTPHCPYIGENRALAFNPALPKGLKAIHFKNGDIAYTIDVDMQINPADNAIEYLDFSKNVLHSWGKPIGPLPNIKYLDFSQNYCNYIGPEFFDNMPTLEVLQIHSNLLGAFLSDMSNSGIFNGLQSLRVLNVSANRVTKVHDNILAGLSNLECLDVSSNNIENLNIDIKQFQNLTRLNLAFNFIGTLPNENREQIRLNAERLHRNFTIDMRNNTIPYTCDNIKFIEWLVQHEGNMFGIHQYIFENADKKRLSYEFVKQGLNDLDKSCRTYTVIYVITSVGISIFLCTVVGGLIYKNRWKLRYFMYMSRTRFFGNRRGDYEIIENYRHDAFVSYAEEDIRFIRDRIIPKLENRDLSLIIHQRDFLPGYFISDNIISAIQESKKTVVILSRQFLKKKWCMYEFNMARMESIYSRGENGCLVVVMLEAIPAKEMPLEMLEWIQEHSYIECTTDERGEDVFWDNLEHAIKS